MPEMIKSRYALALVMPVYNEEACITDVVSAWIYELSSLGIDFVMIVLNDGSRDSTKDKLSCFEGNDRIAIVNKANSGHGPTILQGYRRAVDMAEWVFQTDSDNEMKPDYFVELWKRREDYDALIGSRINRDQSIARRIISAGSRATVSLFFGSGVADVNSPYRLMRSSVLKRIIDRIPDDAFAPNVIISGAFAALKARLFNCPVPHEGRRTGSVSIVRLKLWKAAFRSFRQTVDVARQFRS